MFTLLLILLYSLPLVGIGCMLRFGFGGPKAGFRICLLVAVIGGFLGGALGEHLGIGPYGGLFPPLIGVVAVIVCGHLRRNWVAELAASAVDVKTFGLTYFRFLDNDRNGVITRLDLEDLRASFTSDSENTALFRIIDRNLNLIGHVVESRVSAISMAGVVTVETYGISRADFESWPARVSQLYHEEFGNNAANVGG